MYITYIFRTIVLIFVDMFIITFRPLYASAFFRWLDCRTLFRSSGYTVLVPWGMFNGYQLAPVNFPSGSSPLPSPGIELTLFGYVTWLTNSFIHCAMCPWGHMCMNFWVLYYIINLMASSTIFTSVHIAILMLSLHFFFTRAHIATLLLLLLFYGTPYYDGRNLVINMATKMRTIVWKM